MNFLTRKREEENLDTVLFWKEFLGARWSSRYCDPPMPVLAPTSILQNAQLFLHS